MDVEDRWISEPARLFKGIGVIPGQGKIAVAFSSLP